MSKAISTVIPKPAEENDEEQYIDLDTPHSDSLKTQKTDVIGRESANTYETVLYCTSSQAAGESCGLSQHTDPLVRPVPRPRRIYMNTGPPPLPPRPSTACGTDALCMARPLTSNQDLSREIKTKTAPSLSHDKWENEDYQSYSQGEIAEDTTFDLYTTATDVYQKVYVEFHEDKFEEDGVCVEEHRSHLLCKKDFRIASVGDSIIVAWSNRSGFAYKSGFSIGDVILSVNLQKLNSITAFYELVRTSVVDKIKVQVYRCPYGDMAHITLPQENHIDALGVTFDDGDFGSEITSIDKHGLLKQSNHPAHPQVHGIVNAGKLVNWNLVEINGVAVPFKISKEEVKQRLVDAGPDLALLLLPSDLIKVFYQVYACETLYE